MDEAALRRIRANFPCPTQPMGEAWFMGNERALFKELLGDLGTLSAYELQRPLEEIASGTSCFGPLEEWTDWYHYLLGALLPRAHENFVYSLLEYLTTGFMAIYPTGVAEEPYPSFKRDMLGTLGRMMMDPRCWQGSEIAVGAFLHRSNNNPRQVWCWWDASGDLSSAFFLCLKYLDVAEVEGWFRSALVIPSPHWRAQVLAWLVGAHSCLLNGAWPSTFKTEASPSVEWAWSHCIGPELVQGDFRTNFDFLPVASRGKVLKLVNEYFTDEVYSDWLTSISNVPYLQEELAEVLSRFEGIYLSSQ